MRRAQSPWRVHGRAFDPGRWRGVIGRGSAQDRGALQRDGLCRSDIVRELAKIPGFTCRRVLDEGVTIRGKLCWFLKLRGVPEGVRRRVVSDLSKTPFPEELIVGHAGVRQDGDRGDERMQQGMQILSAGIIYRPVRERIADSGGPCRKDG